MKLEQIKAVVFDLDGTIYYGSKIIPGANSTIRYFRENNKQIYFVTNNSTKTRRQIFEKLLKLGVDCAYEEVLTSGYVAAIYMKQKQLKNVYIFGSRNLINEFEEQGINVKYDTSAENLLIGYDPELTYKKITNALQVAFKAKCIIACNKERTFPGENKDIMPGCGAMVASIEWCANRKCDMVIGKPNTLIIDTIVDLKEYKHKEILIVGDTYESDVKMAQKAGCQSILINKTYHKGTIVVDKITDIMDLFDK